MVKHNYQFKSILVTNKISKSNFRFYPIVILLALSFLFSIKLNASVSDKSKNQGDSVFISYQLRIELLGKQLAESRYNDLIQDSINKLLLQEMDVALKTEGSYRFPFDSLSQISKVQSQDGEVRIFTWFTLKNDNKFTYYGYLTYYLKSEKKQLVYFLNDSKETITNPENQVLTNQNWYGVVYYDLLENKSANGKIYTLIGWDGKGAFSNSKVIDILTFTESGKPKFGKAMFKIGKKKDKRLIFEYNKRASMLITFDENLKMIVFDHLAPINNSGNGNSEFLGPDLSYDGLKYVDDNWEYQSDLDYKPSKRGKKSR